MTIGHLRKLMKNLDDDAQVTIEVDNDDLLNDTNLWVNRIHPDLKKTQLEIHLEIIDDIELERRLEEYEEEEREEEKESWGNPQYNKDEDYLD